ncbi:MAG: methionine--tRNA ligase [Gemmatimonadaceae bacterium]
MARFYVTTAIDYANGEPHLGHAFEKIGTDAIARYHRLAGDDVWFLTGMDEHGQKVAQTAASRGVAPQEFVDEIASIFRAMWARLSISYDQFIRTTDPQHKAAVRVLLERIFERNPDDFFERAYEGWYCVGCELFKRDDEIVDGRCVLHPTRELEWTEERNWFFRLSRYQSFLQRLFDERPDFLLPESRRNEILRLIEAGVEDVSVSRARLSWAVPFPRPTSDGVEQGTWVWFDALPNYLTATCYLSGRSDTRWPAQLHVVGKDITRLHAVIWPAMLEAAGVPLPERVFAHGFISLGGERFSKSSGVKLELIEAIDRFGADAFRYFLLREIPFDGDGNFSWERFEDRYTSDLANSLGNLASRTVAMVEKYRGGVVPANADVDLERRDAPDLASYRDAMEANLLHEALAALGRVVARGNEFVQAHQPWALDKDPARHAELDATLAALVAQLARVAIRLAPFMPSKCQELWTTLGGPGSVHDQRLASPADSAGWRVTKGAPLFPRPEPAKFD